MSHAVSCDPVDAALWSKVPPRRRVSVTRQPRKSWRVSCEKPLRWSPVEDSKQKAVQIEQAVEHRMPDTQNLYALDHHTKAFRHHDIENAVVLLAKIRNISLIRHRNLLMGSFSDCTKGLMQPRFSAVTKQRSQGPDTGHIVH